MHLKQNEKSPEQGNAKEYEMKRILAVIMTIALVFSLCACKDTKKDDELLNKGVELLHKQERQKSDIEDALECFERSAKSGNDAACFLAGWTLDFEIMPKTADNLKKAFEYYEKCEESKAFALIAEGLMYIEGIGFEADEEKAMELISKGVGMIDEDSLLKDTGLTYCSEALNLLGIVYLGSYTVDEDCEKAVSYFQKGAQNNSVKSLIYTGYMYLNGWGVETDYMKAMDYFKKAYQNADKEAMYYMGYMYHEGLGVDEDSEKAFECFLEAAEDGHIYSMMDVSSAYSNGDGVQADQELAKQWYEKAIAAGYVE